MKRRWLWLVLVSFLALALLWLANVSRPGRVAGCFHGCAAGEGQAAQSLRVMSLNILHGRPEFENLQDRIDLIAGAIRSLKADIVCLQEVPWTPSLGSGAEVLAQATGLNHVSLRANGNRWAILFEEGEAVLSRYPILETAWTELQPRAAAFEHRVALRATVATPLGEVAVFVTHLTDGEPEINRRQALGLMDFVMADRVRPAIVAGDFNAQPGSPQIEMLLSHWTDTYLAANAEDPGFTCCLNDLTALPGQPLEKRIDYVFLVPGAGQELEVLSARRVLDEPARVGVRWQWASDHVGLLVDLGEAK